jgi:hypothetical protein
MEDVLDLYHEPYDRRRPMVCFDEGTKQLFDEVQEPLPMEPGQPQRYDYEYERKGTANLFVCFEPLQGWRHVKVTDQRTMVDYAQCMKELVDVHYPEADCIRVVQDNLSTHKPAALYEAFPPEEARRILGKLEFHYTPKHGSWLNMAEIELNVLGRQCLDRRIGDKHLLIDEVAAWEDERNAHGASTKWRFTTADARVKLHHLYPSLDT